MKYLITLGVVAFTIVGFIYYSLFISPMSEITRDDNEIELVANEVNLTDSIPFPKDGTGTLGSLMALNEAMECKINYQTAVETEKIEGTFFVSEGKMRSDVIFESPEIEGQILSSIIIDDKEVYTWSIIESEGYGVKTTIENKEDFMDDINTPINTNTAVNYECQPWKSIDNSIFNPPSDILFRDINELRQTGMEYGVIYESEDDISH